MQRWMLAALLVAMAALATWLRVRGLSFGLPAVYNPDEAAIMTRALAFAKGDLNPHNFLYPTLYFYVLFLWVGASFALGWLAGAISSAAAFQQSFFLDPTGIYLAGRVLTVFCGVASVLLTWRLGERLVDRSTGLAAAAFLAAAPFAVLDAHYVKHDVPATLAIVLAFAAIVRLLHAERNARRWTVAAGLAAGLAASVHYYAVFVGLPLVLAAWWTGGRARGRRMAGAAGFASVGFVLGSPFLLVEPLTAWRDVTANRRIVVDRAVEGGDGLFASAGAYLSMLPDASGWPVVVLAVPGLVLLARRRPRAAVLCLAFAVPFMLFISNTVPATRYVNPLLPFIALFAGTAVTVAAAAVHRWTGRPEAEGRVPAGAAALAITIAAAAPGVADSVRVGSFLQAPDTRTLAREYIHGTLPEGAGVLVQPYSVALAPTRASLVEVLRRHVGDESRASIRFRLRLAASPWPRPAYRLLHLGEGGLDLDREYVGYAELDRRDAVQALAARGIELVVLKAGRSLAPAARPLRERLRRDARLLATISPYGDDVDPGRADLPEPFVHNTDARIVPGLVRPGPVLEIWQLAPPAPAGAVEAVQ